MAPLISSIVDPATDDLTGARTTYSQSTGVDGSTPAIRASLEEPSASQVANGVTNIRGWAVGLNTIQRIALYIDNNYVSDIPYGGERLDVGQTFSNYLHASKSRFSMIYNWGNLPTGQHTMEIRAFDSSGGVESQSTTFTVRAFENAFISDPNLVEILSSATVTDPRTITLDQVRADGKTYKVVLRWNTATQK